MNSDQIKSRFGSYGLEILAQTQELRLANLFSEHQGQRVCRTLALTQFRLPTPANLSELDREIRQGASIGATLRAAGWRVVKSDPVFATAPAGERFSALAGEAVTPDTAIGIQIYSLQVSDDIERLEYAVIGEAYHPEHVAPPGSAPAIADLENQLNPHQQAAIDALIAALAGP